MENDSAGIFTEENQDKTPVEMAQKQEEKVVVDNSADPSSATQTETGVPEFDDPKPYERTDWEKRYGDVRRYMDKVVKEKEEQIASLQEQVNSGKEWNVPKTHEEIEALKTSDPKLYEAIEYGAKLHYDSGVEELKRSNLALKKEAELSKLKLLHPDFEEVKNSQEFKSWLKAQPTEINEWFYKKLDASLAARGLDLYKSTLSENTSKPEKNPVDTSAAKAVQTKNTVVMDGKEEHIYTQEEVRRMSDEEYESKRKVIDRQIQMGLVR